LEGVPVWALYAFSRTCVSFGACNLLAYYFMTTSHKCCALACARVGLVVHTISGTLVCFVWPAGELSLGLMFLVVNSFQVVTAYILFDSWRICHVLSTIFTTGLASALNQGYGGGGFVVLIPWDRQLQEKKTQDDTTDDWVLKVILLAICFVAGLCVLTGCFGYFGRRMRTTVECPTDCFDDLVPIDVGRRHPTVRVIQMLADTSIYTISEGQESGSSSAAEEPSTQQLSNSGATPAQAVPSPAPEGRSPGEQLQSAAGTSVGEPCPRVVEQPPVAEGPRPRGRSGSPTPFDESTAGEDGSAGCRTSPHRPSPLTRSSHRGRSPRWQPAMPSGICWRTAFANI